MEPIKGWVYLVFGAIMVLSSQLIKYKDGTKPLRVFLYIGILFMLIGIGKYVFRRNKKEKSAAALHQPANLTQQSAQQHNPMSQNTQNQAHYQAHHQAQNFQQNPVNLNFVQGQHHVNRLDNQQVNAQLSSQHPSIIACPSCGTRHYDYARYCMQCGTRITRVRRY